MSFTRVPVDRRNYLSPAPDLTEEFKLGRRACNLFADNRNSGRPTDGLVQSAQHAANMPILPVLANQFFLPIGFVGRQLKDNVLAVYVLWAGIRCRRSELG
jgi:hypothetical protein